MGNGSDLIVRPAAAGDVAAIQAIYAHHVLHGTGTFELVPPSVEEMAERIAAITTRGLPYMVAEMEGRVAGYAYAGPFRLRAAYSYTAEDTVYVSPDFHRRGVGRAVLARVIEDCERLGLHQLVAVIGGSDNAGSIGLHAALGFEPAGVTPGLGWKDGRWNDVVWMQRPLNGGVSRPPEGPGLGL
jgi:phosphinothricin acetyltransferase